MRDLSNIVDDLRRLAVEYYRATEKPIGVTGELAEYLAAQALGLTLAPARAPGYDAVDTAGRKLQIKGRWKSDGRAWGRVSRIDTTKDFGAVLLVLMSGAYDLAEIWEAPRDAVIRRLDAPGSKARNRRRSMGVSQFKTIATRVWPADPRRSA